MAYEYKVKTVAPQVDHKSMDQIMDEVEHKFQDALNEMAKDGWEFVRMEKVPVLFQKAEGSGERQLLYQDVGVFRRPQQG